VFVDTWLPARMRQWRLTQSVWMFLKVTMIHKWLVFRECWKLGIPARGLAHDWDKFLPGCWIDYALHGFNGDSQANVVSRQSFDFVRFMHKHRNDHHWQWWVGHSDDGKCLVFEMSDGARKEMVADWRAAAQQKSNGLLSWYGRMRNSIQLHPVTRAKVESELRYSVKCESQRGYQ